MPMKDYCAETENQTGIHDQGKKNLASLLIHSHCQFQYEMNVSRPAFSHPMLPVHDLEQLALSTKKYGHVSMAGRKIEVLKGEIRQMKFKISDLQTQVSNLKKDISAINEKFDSKFSILEEMLKKVLEGQIKKMSSEVREVTDSQRSGENPKLSRRREDQEGLISVTLVIQAHKHMAYHMFTCSSVIGGGNGVRLSSDPRKQLRRWWLRRRRQLEVETVKRKLLRLRMRCKPHASKARQALAKLRHKPHKKLDIDKAKDNFINIQRYINKCTNLTKNTIWQKGRTAKPRGQSFTWEDYCNKLIDFAVKRVWNV
ncbi:hypothetical protein M5K25_016932 [Dendrobium thyrsiflorum]|uniref:Uncharacterized protein n=1 Tax=Dendrobium thyrsiflorum TaxID=117978 RepID=A0ABD0UL49_DENTH